MQKLQCRTYSLFPLYIGAPISMWVCVYKCRANLCACSNSGVDVTYSSGVNTWRDQLKPTQLLQNVARFKGFPPPILSEDGNRIRYGGRDYSLDEFGKHIVINCKLATKYSKLFTSLGSLWGGGGQRSTLIMAVETACTTNKSPIVAEFCCLVKCLSIHIFLSVLCFTWPFQVTAIRALNTKF